ncbi:MAG: ABC transporter ATP-binding protein/permease [Hyphomicrobiaceae bacterium]|nr:ABC transporter ATP-binding protein/permease [Hyphomicrobiaceae bacterium]
MFHWFETRIKAFPDEAPEQPPDRLAAFYWHFVRPVWPVFLVLLAVGLAGSLIEVALYAFIGSIVDRMKEAASPQTFITDNGGMLLLMGFVALVLRPLVSTAHDLVKNQMIAGPFNTRVRWQSHRYVLRQSLGFFQNDFAGRVAAKVLQTGHALRESVVQVIDGLWFAVVHWGAALVLFADADWRLAIPLLAWLAAYGVTIRQFVPRIQRLSFNASEARSVLTGRVVDSYTNMLTVKLFAHADREDESARVALQDHLDRYQESQRNLTRMEFVLYSINGALMVTATGLAIWLWSVGAVTIGAVALITALVIRLIGMSGWILMTVATVFEAIGTVEEGMETISRPVDVVDKPGARPLAVDRGEVRYENVSFHYGKEGGVIDRLSLRIAPGEKVGLVGRSGAGKSTLVNLLLRFYDLEGGRILIDGQDIAGVTQDSLRAQVGMVTQDTSLLHRSVMENILYGRPGAGEAAAVAAARKAHAHDFIVGLQDMRGREGYAAQVGERGVKLSGGQRQRVAIARVLLKNAPILILDEATSALDSEVEAAIQEQLYNLMEGKTVIAIAHRLSTIAAMDRLVIMDQGRIVEQGSHGELLSKGGLYAELWARQSGGFMAKEAAE